MIRKTNRITSPAATAAIIALAVPAIASANVDVRNPDSKAAAIDAQQGPVDLRNPDSKETGTVVGPRQRTAWVDLLGPDAQDAGKPAHAPAPRPTDASGFDRSDTALAAGGILALLLIGGSAMFVVTHRRRHGLTA